LILKNKSAKNKEFANKSDVQNGTGFGSFTTLGKITVCALAQ